MRQILSIASTTHREASRQAIFWVLLGVFGGLILISGELTLFGLGAEAVMIREMGLSSISLCSLLLILFTATQAIYSEMENQTLLTLLSKPVSRAAVMLGKFLGIVRAVVGAAVILALLLVLALWWFGGLAAVQRAERADRYREQQAWNRHYESTVGLAGPGAMATPPAVAIQSSAPSWSSYREQVTQTFLPGLVPMLQGLVLIMLQCLILTAISASLSVRFGFQMNAIGTSLVFTAGHLSPYVYHRLAAPDSSMISRFVGEILYCVTPNLENYNLSSLAAQADGRIAGEYLWMATGAALAYTSFALLLGIWLFERTQAAGARE